MRDRIAMVWRDRRFCSWRDDIIIGHAHAARSRLRPVEDRTHAPGRIRGGRVSARACCERATCATERATLRRSAAPRDTRPATAVSPNARQRLARCSSGRCPLPSGTPDDARRPFSPPVTRTSAALGRRHSSSGRPSGRSPVRVQCVAASRPRHRTTRPAGVDSISIDVFPFVFRRISLIVLLFCKPTFLTST